MKVYDIRISNQIEKGRGVQIDATIDRDGKSKRIRQYYKIRDDFDRDLDKLINSMWGIK